MSIFDPVNLRKGASMATTLTSVPQREVRISSGTIRYRELGTGEPVVFVHGLLANSLLWDEVFVALAPDFRVIAPDWPIGSNEVPLDPGADTSIPGLAEVVAEFLEALDLTGVTLVGNDTGGVVCQIVAGRHPERLARLVLTPCDAYENCPPPAFAPLAFVGRSRLALRIIAAAMRPTFMQRLPIAYGLLSKRPLPRSVARSFIEPLGRNPLVRRQAAATLASLKPAVGLDAAARLRAFEKPVLIAWAPADKFFKLRFAERLFSDLPHARIERIEDSYTFVSIDQPRRTAELIAAFARQRAEALA
jgi:pimeloyl-ACP methyl ester carboxylesterase